MKRFKNVIIALIFCAALVALGIAASRLDGQQHLAEEPLAWV